MKAKEKQLLEYLKHCLGQENAVSGKRLKKILRVHEAELRKLVHNLRVDGAPICSDRTGYFYPHDAREVFSTILQLQANGSSDCRWPPQAGEGHGRLPACMGR